MKKTITLLSLLFCMGALLAQPGPSDRPPRNHEMQIDQVKEYLGLNDQQITGLKAIQTAMQTEAAPTRESLMETARALREALHQNPVVQATVDSLKSEIEQLQQKMQALREKYRAQTLDLLSTEQKTLLVALEKAIELMPAARQAAWLNLVDSPQKFLGGPDGLPMGGGQEGQGGPGMPGRGNRTRR